jgi:hypothetical protein
MAPSVDGVVLQQTTKEVTAVLVHLKKLLRVRNLLCSPFLRLATETILHILSFVMADMDSCYWGYSRAWTSIYSTCHRIHKIMCGATELWWKVDCARGGGAHFAFMRSKGDPEVIVSDLHRVSDQRIAGIERILDYWRDGQKFKGHRLHTFEFSGTPSSFTHFSWILERPLPRLERLKLIVADPLDDDWIDLDIDFEPPNPVALELPMDMALQVLDLRNVILPWSSHLFLFTGLRELHLNFRGCDPVVTIPEDELFGIFDASPQLERLSLLQVGHEVPVEDGILLPPKRILQLPNLSFLKVENSPEVVKYTLTYMGLPVIASLEIRSHIPPNVGQISDLLFPDDRLQARLFQNPATFAVRTVGKEGPDTSIEIEIGSIKLRIDFPYGTGQFGRDVVMACIPQLVPPSVTTLKLDYTGLHEQGWREFFRSHPEVRSIECTEFCGIPVPRLLWDALSPGGEDNTGALCPKLESIVITSYTDEVVFTPLIDCLQTRQNAGFKLRLLEVVDSHQLMPYGFAAEFGPLVEVVDTGKPNPYEKRVSPVPVREFCVC